MIVKWNSDINHGGKWLCGKVSSQFPSSLCTQWKLSQEQDDKTEQTDESWPHPSGAGLPPAGCCSHLQWSLCRVCSTRRGSPGGQVSAGSPRTPRGSFLRHPAIIPCPAYCAWGRPQWPVIASKAHPTLTPDTKFRFKNVRESTIRSCSYPESPYLRVVTI